MRGNGDNSSTTMELVMLQSCKKRYQMLSAVAAVVDGTLALATIAMDHKPSEDMALWLLLCGRGGCIYCLCDKDCHVT